MTISVKPDALARAAFAEPPAAAAPRNDLLLRACRGLPTERPPVWMMRQAGRYLPEYQAVRRQAGGFLNMVRSPELATEVTLQPVDIMGVDAAIIFSDILVVPHAMGMALEVDEGVGPHFDAPVRSAADVARLRAIDPQDELGYVLDAIRLTRRELGDRVPLIGFAGGPWTLAAYMIEGRGTKQFQVAKRLILSEPALAHALLDRMATAVGEFLVAQAEAGAQVLQLFESWAGALAPAEFRAFALPYLARAARIARSAGVPLIVFAPGAAWAMREIAEATGADVVGIDWQTEAADARRLAAELGVAVQGNLDPCALYAPRDEIRARTREMLRQMPPRGYVANLGHGILPDVPVDHARTFIDTVRAWRGAPAA
ncbi:MAG: Uroporphyrinogen III decarboxylase [uncultured Gemmatimonadaceae bacterium]|uniref:Uroporphyrinogen decarboxylase n=1 Tax=uncultured Gemmatimonadaceae bacterium TaxID=246130 RepID=A0A6J4KRN3_9BACT|nr:MAG: Uroporphyrinogen III decarboxylase [uncultured Gemmatimonadaceae bacterium]